MGTASKAIDFGKMFGGHRKFPVAVVFSLAICILGLAQYSRSMGMQVFFTLIVFGILAGITWFDFRTQTIPDFLNIALAVAGGLAVMSLNLISLGDASAGLVIGVLVPFGLRAAFQVLRGVDGLGLGDVKFLGASGLWVGVSGLPWLVLLASLSGLAFALAVHLVSKNFTRQTRLAFGPHLALGLIATWIFKLNGIL